MNLKDLDFGLPMPESMVDCRRNSSEHEPQKCCELAQFIPAPSFLKFNQSMPTSSNPSKAHTPAKKYAL